MTSRLYEVFGGTWRSEQQIEELPASESRAPDWTLRVIDGSSTAPEGELPGMDLVYGETHVRGYRRSDGLGLIFDGTGRFDGAGVAFLAKLHGKSTLCSVLSWPGEQRSRDQEELQHPARELPDEFLTGVAQRHGPQNLGDARAQRARSGQHVRGGREGSVRMQIADCRLRLAGRWSRLHSGDLESGPRSIVCCSGLLTLSRRKSRLLCS